MRRLALLSALLLATVAFVAPSASAHEHYQSDDGLYSIVLGEQNEPVYTYDWTNLDLIVHEDAENGTGGAVPGVHETVNATLVSPGGEELELPIEPQFGEKGRYEFVQDYFLTQPGQYEVRLTGDINGTDVSGTYKLPGPRESMADQGFPADEVPTLLTLDEAVSELQETQQDNAQLQQKVDELESKVDELESEVSSLRTTVDEIEAQGGSAGENSQQNAPAVGPALAAALIGLVALVHTRRRD